MTVKVFISDGHTHLSLDTGPEWIRVPAVGEELTFPCPPPRQDVHLGFAVNEVHHMVFVGAPDSTVVTLVCYTGDLPADEEAELRRLGFVDAVQP